MHMYRVINKKTSRELPHVLFYQNVSLILVVHIFILPIHSRFIGCLPFDKSIVSRRVEKGGIQNQFITKENLIFSHKLYMYVIFLSYYK
jgi:hypothetical protein